MKRYLLYFICFVGFLLPVLLNAQTKDDTSDDPTNLPIPSSHNKTINNVLVTINKVQATIASVQGNSNNVQTTSNDLTKDLHNLQQNTNGIKITETETELKIEVLGDILFDFNKITLRPSANETLKKIAEFLNRQQVKQLKIAGHTDSIGTEPYNQNLSKKRAETVRDWFLKNLQQKPTIKVEAYAARQPVAPNQHPDGSDNPEGRQQNRRVEIFVPKNS
ncbi:MAG: OmpA family protein [Alphaproteobacteria bacterium]|nr:OmpA family protein [Alphaproteobacteria bacterium]